MVPHPAMGLAALGISNSTLNDFTAALKCVVADGVSAAVPSPSLFALTGKVATLSFLHLCFACVVAVDGDLSHIWEVVAQGKWRMEGLATLNQSLILGLTYCSWVFGGRDHFSDYPPPPRFSI